PLNVEERLDLCQNEIEGPGLVAASRLDRIAVHWIACPYHDLPFPRHGADQRRKVLSDLAGAEAADQRETPGLVLRVEDVYELEQLVGPKCGTDLQPDRVLDDAQIFDMSVVGLSCAVADPQHVPRGGVPVARGRIDPREGLLVAEQKRLVARIEARGAELWRVVRVQPAGAHEAQGLGYVSSELLIAVSCRAILDEAQVPSMHMLEVGIAALSERAHQIERRRRLPISHQHPLGICLPRRLGELDAIDDVAAIARQ